MRIYTVGYGNRGFPAFVELLRLFAVTHVVDVRRVPESSYWKDFSRASLVKLVPQAGFKYVFMGDTLGAARGLPADSKVASVFNLGIERLLSAATTPERTLCLMCGCMKPNSCHRYSLISPALIAAGVEIAHIGPKNELLSQQEVAAEVAQHQQTLFESI